MPEDFFDWGLQFGLFRVGKTQTIPFNLEAYNEAREWMFNTVKEIRECNLWNEKNRKIIMIFRNDYRNQRRILSPY